MRTKGGEEKLDCGNKCFCKSRETRRHGVQNSCQTRQNKGWKMCFCKTTSTFPLDTAHALVRFRHENHLVRVQKYSCSV